MESESYVTLFLVIKLSKNSFNLNTARIKHDYPFILIDTCALHTKCKKWFHRMCKNTLEKVLMDAVEADWFCPSCQ